MKSKNKKTLAQSQHQAVGSLLVDILVGNIRDETRLKLNDVEEAKIPKPYNHLTGYTLGSDMDGRELAKDLLEELRIICIEIQEDSKVV